MSDFSPESGAPVAAPSDPALDAVAPAADPSPAGPDAGQEHVQEVPAQKRIDELTFHRRRAERVAAEAVQENAALQHELMRLRQGGQQQQPAPEQGQQPAGDRPPQPEQFREWGEYMAALADYRYRFNQQQDQARAATFAEQQQRAHVQAMQQHEARVREATLSQTIESASKKYADFEQVVSNPQLPSLRQVHPGVLDAITYSEHSGDVLYYLGKNVAEAQKLAAMHPVQAIREIGRLEAKLAAGQVQFSAAPPPVANVGSRASGADPLSDKSSIEAWMAARNRQVRKGK